MDVLIEHVSGLSKRQAREALMSGLVKVDKNIVNDVHLKLDTKPKSIELDLRHGSKSSLEEQKEQRPFQIIHMEDDFIVVDKASGILASQPKQLDEQGYTPKHLADYLRRTLKKMNKDAPYIGYVHRLDQETSGCICLAFTKEAHRKLSEQFQEKTAQRHYRCLVTGHPQQNRDTLKGVIARGYDGRRKMLYGHDIDGEKAVTHFQVVERLEGGADCLVSLETGRTHQVRLAMASIGAPIFGDSLYGDRKKIAPRLMLHAWKMSIQHPKTGETMNFEAPVPKQFKSCRPPRPGKFTRPKPNYSSFRSSDEKGARKGSRTAESFKPSNRGETDPRKGRKNQPQQGGRNEGFKGRGGRRRP